ncbi:hypothetical protein OE88DRAFT_1680663 [Heliocybe sulcata]|uniref:ARM repeat-containing protein n=1 Tax=Heliocybe sulcata TaxID=5364 RepID=A0A5C3N0L2_9AGAM|nr:hypothetical protein OE88DRAFT_1680663 [Heliocybe sulcata]
MEVMKRDMSMKVQELEVAFTDASSPKRQDAQARLKRLSGHRDFRSSVREAGLVTHLSDLLHHSDPAIKQSSLGALSGLAKHDDFREEIWEGLPRRRMLDLLDHPHEPETVHAAITALHSIPSADPSHRKELATKLTQLHRNPLATYYTREVVAHTLGQLQMDVKAILEKPGHESVKAHVARVVQDGQLESQTKH